MKRRTLQLAVAAAAILGLCCAGAPAASAAPPTAPATATTGPALDVTATSATLSGVVHTNGQASTAWQFEYGTSARYGTFTPAHTVSGANRDVTVFERISALKPGTVYHFQLVALSSVATSETTYTLLASPGGDAAFRTATVARLRLRKSSVVVKLNRTVFVALMCARSSARTNPCNGRITIVAHAGRATVGCGHASFAINLGHTKRIFVRATRACVALLQSTPSHRVTGTVSASMLGRTRLRKRVTLILR